MTITRRVSRNPNPSPMSHPGVSVMPWVRTFQHPTLMGSILHIRLAQSLIEAAARARRVRLQRSHQSQLRIVYRDLKTDLDDCEVVFTMLDAHGWREIVGEARLREMDNIAQYRKMLMGQQKELMRAGEELQKKPSILPPPELPRDYMKLESYEEEKRSKSEERPPATLSPNR